MNRPHENHRAAGLHQRLGEFNPHRRPGGPHKVLSVLTDRRFLLQIALLFGLCLLSVMLAMPAPDNYRPGSVAGHTIRADRDLMVPDFQGTELRRQAAGEAVRPVFLLNDLSLGILAPRVDDLFERGRRALALVPLGDHLAGERLLAGVRADFGQVLGGGLDDRLWDALLVSRFDARVERAAVTLAMEVMSLGVLGGPGEVGAFAFKPVTVQVLSSRNEFIVPSAAGLLDMGEAATLLDQKSLRLTLEFSGEDLGLIRELARGLLQPTLSLDREETDSRRAAAMDAVPLTYFDIRAGEVIVREGAQVTDSVEAKLAALKAFHSERDWLFKAGGLLTMLFVFFLAHLVLLRSSPTGVKDASVKQQLLLVSLLALAAVMTYFGGLIGQSLAGDFDFLDSRAFYFMLPLPAVSMLVAIFFGLRLAGAMTIFTAVVATAVTPGVGSFSMFLYTLNGAVAGIWCLGVLNERGHLIPAAFWVAAVNCLTILGLTMFSENNFQWGRQTAYNFCAAGLGGLLSGIVASGMVALIEALFGFTTSLKMMELGNLDRPILRELMLTAPGTYHHSVIVGAMVEAAAETIGANPHLAKVGAYYHDIGKLKKPLYFVENQAAGENRHDALSPSMSALILIGHVKDGVELTRAHKLPKAIVDIVEQHHGTSLMAYFYHKAKETRQPGQPEVNEADFRYPGPKPRRKEAGLVMMADICEAATRSLSEPTPAKIHNLVRHLINQVFSDGQLDECDLSLKEVSKVIQTFDRILIGIYHHRVAYPGGKKSVGPATEAEKQVKERIYGRMPDESPKGFTH